MYKITSLIQTVFSQQAYDFAAIDTMMIGDAIFDLQMGKAANVKTCAVTWGSHSVEQLSAENPDFIIDEALQLLAII
ncbi:HAD family hydrolase [Kurthia zopfii]|uniref:HAD family hydrolase n=1 Tax=Kurthia zopfii TaxID=1650 RepID=UPI0027D9A392|nr:HAD hydrolase-like protein [Kurthia zopfii]